MLQAERTYMQIFEGVTQGLSGNCRWLVKVQDMIYCLSRMVLFFILKSMSFIFLGMCVCVSVSACIFDIKDLHFN